MGEKSNWKLDHGMKREDIIEKMTSLPLPESVGRSM